MRTGDAIGVALFFGVSVALGIGGRLEVDLFVAAVVGWLLGYAVRMNYERSRR